MDFNSQTLIYAAAGSILFSVGIAVYCFLQARRQREALEACLEKNEEMGKTLAACRERLDAISVKNEDLSRLTAWLETRVRERHSVSDKKDSETRAAAAAPAETLKSSITERRHRVLSLAERGQNPDSIAATLGMHSGEVELILNLNRAIAA